MLDNRRNPSEQGHANPSRGYWLASEPGEQGSKPESSSHSGAFGRALFEFKGKTYLATFPAHDPNDVEFIDLDDLPHFVGAGEIGSEGH